MRLSSPAGWVMHDRSCMLLREKKNLNVLQGVRQRITCFNLQIGPVRYVCECLACSKFWAEAVITLSRNYKSWNRLSQRRHDARVGSRTRKHSDMWNFTCDIGVMSYVFKPSSLRCTHSVSNVRNLSLPQQMLPSYQRFCRITNCTHECRWWFSCIMYKTTILELPCIHLHPPKVFEWHLIRTGHNHLRLLSFANLDCLWITAHMYSWSVAVI